MVDIAEFAAGLNSIRCMDNAALYTEPVNSTAGVRANGRGRILYRVTLRPTRAASAASSNPVSFMRSYLTDSHFFRHSIKGCQT